MHITGKKKIRELEGRKPLAPSRLIKCYVCNQHFDSQPTFDVHLKQHQNKLNRDTQDQLQRKTQESFRKNKVGSNMHRTLTALRKEQKVSSEKEVKKQISAEKNEEERLQNSEQKQVEQALRQSTILLQRIQMLTEPKLDDRSDSPSRKIEEEAKPMEKYIKGERELYKLLKKEKNEQQAEKYIVSTALEMKGLQNYQEQLIHLRTLKTYAFAQDTIEKISKITRNICVDVVQQLTDIFEDAHTKEQDKTVRSLQLVELRQSEGQVCSCCECFGRIEGASEYYRLAGGQCFHKQCWEGST